MITSNKNTNVKSVISLRDKAKVRRSEGLFLAEGIRMVLESPKELLRDLYLAESILLDSEKRRQVEAYLDYNLDELTGCDEISLSPNIRIFLVSDDVMKTMSDTLTPQGILAVIVQPSYSLDEILNRKPAQLLVLEHIQDPGNLGTMFRTAEGAGTSAILMTRDTVDLFSPKVIRSTMGSIYRMPFLVVDDLAQTIHLLQEDGIQFFAAHLKGETNYDLMDYQGPTAFLIGNEGNGLSDEIAKCADKYIRIPMGGQLESLNAAMAAGILMYEAARQRRQ